MNPFAPGPTITVDGIEYYEITGYGIWGRLLVECKMVRAVPVEEYDDFIQSLIDKQLERQRLIKEARRDGRLR